MLGGSRGMLIREIFEKRCYLVHSERSEIINLKSTTLGIINQQQQQKSFGIFFFDQSRCACK